MRTPTRRWQMLKCTAFAWLNPSLGSSTYTQRTDSGFLRLMLFPAMHNGRCRPHALLKLRASAGTAVVAAAVHTKFNGLLWNRDALSLSLSLLKNLLFPSPSSSSYASHTLFRRGRARSAPISCLLNRPFPLPQPETGKGQRRRRRSHFKEGTAPFMISPIIIS